MGMENRTFKPRKIGIELVIASLIVVAMAIVTLFSSYGFQSVINEQQMTIQAQKSTISDLQNQISLLNANIDKLKSDVSHLNDANALLAHQLNEKDDMITMLRQNITQSQARIANLTKTISALNAELTSDQQIISLKLINNLGTKTFTIQPSPPDSPYCSYQALTSFQSTYAGYMVLSGYASSERFRVYVTYNTGLESASSWFVASIGTSSINATVPLYPAMITIWIFNCDYVSISGAITVVVYW